MAHKKLISNSTWEHVFHIFSSIRMPFERSAVSEYMLYIMLIHQFCFRLPQLHFFLRYMYKRLESCSSVSFAQVNGVFVLFFFLSLFDKVHKLFLLVGEELVFHKLLADALCRNDTAIKINTVKTTGFKNKTEYEPRVQNVGATQNLLTVSINSLLLGYVLTSDIHDNN